MLHLATFHEFCVTFYPRLSFACVFFSGVTTGEILLCDISCILGETKILHPGMTLDMWRCFGRLVSHWLSTRSVDWFPEMGISKSSCSSSLLFNRFKLFEIVVIPHFQTWNCWWYHNFPVIFTKNSVVAISNVRDVSFPFPTMECHHDVITRDVNHHK